MAHLVVGDKDCDYNLVINTMETSGSFYEIVNQLSSLAAKLGIGPDVVAIVNKNYTLMNQGPTDIMMKYLIRWRGKASRQATLGKLIEALNKCPGLQDIANTIESAEFYVKATEEKNLENPKKRAKLNVPDLLHEQQQNTSFGKSQMNRNSDYQDLRSSVPSSSSGTSNFQEEVLSGSEENTENADEEQTAPRDTTSEEWACRTFVSAKNTTVTLKRGSKGNIRLGKDQYALPGTENGIALILNMISYPDNQHPFRLGAQYDSLKLTQLLTQLGYKVVKFDDPNKIYTKEYVESIIQRFRESVKSENPASVVVFVGGHGTHGKIYMSKGQPIDLFESIIYQFDTGKHQVLKDIPKIFIVNACRNKDQADSNTNRIENAVVCYATLPLNSGYRHIDNGSYYVNSLVKILAENAHHMHFTEMMKKVHADVRKQRIYTKEDVKKPSAEKQHPSHQTPSDDKQHPSYEELGIFGELYFNV